MLDFSKELRTTDPRFLGIFMAYLIFNSCPPCVCIPFMLFRAEDQKSGSAPKPMDPDSDPDADPTLFHTKLRKDVLQMNKKVNKFIIISYTILKKSKS